MYERTHWATEWKQLEDAEVDEVLLTNYGQKIQKAAHAEGQWVKVVLENGRTTFYPSSTAVKRREVRR